MGPPSLLRAPGRGQNWIPEPASSIGSQDSSFQRRLSGFCLRTTVSVANGNPSVPLLLEMVNIDEL